MPKGRRPSTSIRPRPRREPVVDAGLSTSTSKRWAWGIGIGMLVAIGGLFLAISMAPESERALRRRAEAAARESRWEDALREWRKFHAKYGGAGETLLAEARACLALGKVGDAERALTDSSKHAPGDPEPWLIRLEILRVENRLVEAQQVGWRAYDAMSEEARIDVLRALTLALLSDAPDDLARATLLRWTRADPNDLDAIAALDRRMGENPRASDPPILERCARLEGLVASHPEHVGLREALVLALAEAGDVERGRLVLDGWPSHLRDSRFDRLAGRWALEYEGNPRESVTRLKSAIQALPTDWKTRYRLSRALQAIGDTEGARRESREVSRLRELLEPVRLSQRLDAALGKLDQPAAALDLAELCKSAGLERLSAAWRIEAERLAGRSRGRPAQRVPLLPDAPVRHRR